MNIIYVLIPLAVIIVAIAIAVFFWAVRSKQFEDLDRQGYSILFDDDLSEQEKKLADERKALNDRD
ncbi:cbb3-type cytochrome oxidase assembly protein CcoS [Salinimonas marina]|uniref:Cbb3-type cytochrome oxidase assembly protein CcoS n=1 Tax=Salinimonas marina TaxID=2785918 RepID=A0A7S9HEU2_9ALTE|nr:cbb3-type cytochrome oxidase assembly protein CcoS [Salinimonas marina]QPG07021.1 cbb3-type cytochrome oxidase assembly protein CcoS [Salinimonas marina]